MWDIAHASDLIAAEAAQEASSLQIWGAGLFGVVLGWFTYFVNRHRTGGVGLADIGTLVAAIGAGAVLSLFPAGTDMFGAYGVGLFTGFFAYFAVLVVMVLATPGWTLAWFLDGRSPALTTGETQGNGGHALQTTGDSVQG